LQAGGVNPPDPVGTPLGRKAPADISLTTLLWLHCGHFGGGALLENVSSSNSCPQCLQQYS